MTILKRVVIDMQLNIRQVEAFRAVITLGSMTKAAELLGISQPAVSRLMTDFQQAVGFKLFRRLRNSIEPTDDARRLCEQVDRLFVGLEELGEQIQAIKNLTTGTVSIAAMGLYANGVLPDIIGRFRLRHPGVAVRLDSLPQDRVAEWVASRRSDIGFATMPVSNASIPVRELLSRPVLCVFPAGHELESHDVIRAEHLAGHSFISFPRGTPFRFEIDTLFEQRNVGRVMMIEATTHEAVCNLVAAGLGVSIVSPFSPHLRRNPLLEYRPFMPAVPVSLGLVADSESLSSAARAFHDFVVDQFAHPPTPDDLHAKISAIDPVFQSS